MKIKHLSLLPFLTAIAVLIGATSANGESDLSSSAKTFVCETEGDTPTTLAKISNGETQPIFYWDNEALPADANPEQLCNSVAQQLENHLMIEDKLSPIGFKATNLENLPTICLTENNNACQKVLFTLAPAQKPLQTANSVLDSILAPELQENKIASRERGVQSYYYQIDIWSLLGLKFFK